METPNIATPNWPMYIWVRRSIHCHSTTLYSHVREGGSNYVVGEMIWPGRLVGGVESS